MTRMEPERIWYFSRFANRAYTSAKYQLGDALVFGSETVGLPKKLLDSDLDRTLRIPTTGDVRSLNLATSVGVASFEALRQFGLSEDLL